METEYFTGMTKWGGEKTHLVTETDNIWKDQFTGWPVCGAGRISATLPKPKPVSEVAHLKEVDCKNCRNTHAYRAVAFKLGAVDERDPRDPEVDVLMIEGEDAPEDGWPDVGLGKGSKRPSTLRYFLTVEIEVDVEYPEEIQEALNALASYTYTIDRVEVE